MTSALGTLNQQSWCIHHPEHTCMDSNDFYAERKYGEFCLNSVVRHAFNYLDNPKSVTLMVPFESTKQFRAAYEKKTKTFWKF